MISYLKDNLKSSLLKLGIDNLEPVIEKPREEKFGDYSTGIAMSAAKQLKRNPREIANNIISGLNLDKDKIESVSIAGAGFINFTISPQYFSNEITNILKDTAHYGKSTENQNKKVDLEWISANPTGPLHAGHGRHIALGKAVASLLEWNGYNVTREYYYNNAGKQMETLAQSVYARYRQLFEPDYPLPEDAYVGDYVNEIAETIKETYGDKMLEKESNIEFFKQQGESWCFNSIKKTLSKLGINVDVYFNEDDLYKQGLINKILEKFKNAGLSYEKDGAVWLKTSELLKEKKDAQDKVIVKSTGEPTYRLPDMAYHINKLERGFDLCVDIFGADHADTYKEVLAGIRSLGYDISKIKVILHQMVTFMKDGVPVKMSKRSDNTYYLDDLLEDVGVDVAQFFFIMRTANTHLDFDVKLAKEQSDKNPVFYLQYAHARISGILRNAVTVFPDYLNSKEEDFNLLNSDEELELKKYLSFFPESVQNAAETYEPHKIITYLNSLAEKFHRFYHNDRVIDTENQQTSHLRLKLCQASKAVFANGFKIIGISAPERM